MAQHIGIIRDMSKLSPLEFLTIKSKSERAQLELLEAFAEERKDDVATVRRLRTLAEEKFPLDANMTTVELVKLWGLAIWMSDIGTVLTKPMRSTYLEHVSATIEDLKFDRRAVISMSSQADRAIEILND
jgi:hypothetical protein